MLDQLGKALKWCEEYNLLLNRDKSHFMEKERIVLHYRIFEKVTEVDKEIVEVIEILKTPIYVKGLKIFFSIQVYIRYLSSISQKFHTHCEHCLIRSVSLFLMILD